MRLCPLSLGLLSYFLLGCVKAVQVSYDMFLYDRVSYVLAGMVVYVWVRLILECCVEAGEWR